SMSRGLNNYLTNTRGQMDGLVAGGVLAQKQQQQDALKAWMAADQTRAATYAGVLEGMETLRLETVKTRERDASLVDVVRYVRLVSAASTIVRLAEERAKPDAERHPDYQERNWKRLEQGMVALSKQYHRTMDRAVLSLALHRAAKRPAADQTEALKLLLPKGDEKA